VIAASRFVVTSMSRMWHFGQTALTVSRSDFAVGSSNASTIATV
jgi:hypothetical protein